MPSVTTGNKAPQTGEIQVWVKGCMNLSSRRGSIDPFVKWCVLKIRTLSLAVSMFSEFFLSVGLLWPIC